MTARFWMTLLFAALLMAPQMMAQDAPDPDTPDMPEKPGDEKPDDDEKPDEDAKPDEEAKPDAKPAEARRRNANRNPDAANIRYPAWSPDGSMVAFSLHGDIWVMPSDSDRPEQITMHEANDFSPKWTPDGKRLIFTSDRHGSIDMYSVSVEGGRPTRLSFDAGYDHINEVSADGKSLLFQSTRSGAWQLYTMPIGGGEPTLVTLDSPATYGSTSTADDWVYYCYSISDSKVKGYRGTANDDLYRCKPGEIPEQLTANNQSERKPIISPDGKTLYFIRETGESGKDYNLHSMDMESREIKQLTFLDSNGIDYVSFNKDFTQIIFIWKFRIYTFDLSDPDAEAELLPVRIVEDETLPDMVTVTATTGAANFDLSHSGNTIALEVAGGIWTMSSAGGAATPLLPAGKGDQMPKIAPSGRMVAFYSAGRGPTTDIYVCDTAGQNIRRLTNNGTNNYFQCWSADSQFLVFATDIPGTQGDRELFRVSVNGGRPVQLTNAPGDKVSDDPCYSPDGTQIAFDSDRDGNDRDIYIMNADGTNVRRVHGSAGAHDESPRFSPDGQYLVYNRTSTGPRIRQQVVVTDINGTGEVVIGTGHGGIFSRDGEEILYLDARGNLRAVPAPKTFTSGRVIPFMASTEIAEQEQFLNAFNEAWTMVNNNFYMADFHGVDWAGMKKKYEPLVRNCRTKMEFHFLLLNMVGELNASHQGVGGNTMIAQGYNTGRLGAEWVPETMEAKVPANGGRGRGRRGRANPNAGKHYVRLKITEIYKNAPADKSWLRVGDYIFGVNGQRLVEGTSISRLLKDTTGKPIQLMVGTDPEGEEIRNVETTPESSGAKRSRDYRDWIKLNKDTVKKESENKVAYIHIPQMNGTALAQFRRELSSPTVQKAEALVLDVRNNGGGNIHEALFTIFSLGKYANMFNRRTQPGKETPAPSVYWGRPVTVLINRRSYSDAEVFPHGMKTLGLATIVGVQTPGAVIGTNNITLSDGTTFRVTRTGFRNLDGTNQEHNGCMPDIVVDHNAEDRILKNDHQLKAAIEDALKQIKEAASKKDPVTKEGESGDSAATAGANEGNEIPSDEQEEDPDYMPEPANLPVDPLDNLWVG